MTGDRGGRQVQRGLAAGAGDEAGLLAAWPAHGPVQREITAAGRADPGRVRVAETSASLAEPFGEQAPGHAVPAAPERRCSRPGPGSRSREPVTPVALSARAGGGSPRLRLPLPRQEEARPGPARRALPGSRISRSPGSHPSTSQMMSRSSSRMVTGCPDHRFDIFPALITSPASASIRCSWEAFQISCWAAASRRFHFTGCRPRTGPRPGARPWPRRPRRGCGERERRSSWC